MRCLGADRIVAPLAGEGGFAAAGRMIEVERLGLSLRLLSAMGADLASIHAADKRARRIGADLASREHTFLTRATEAAEQMTKSDYTELVA